MAEVSVDPGEEGEEAEDEDASPPPDCRCCGSSSDNARCLMKCKLYPVPPPHSPALNVATARVEAENELLALREALASHQLSIQELYAELEEERNAASTAVSEAMSMILRLQREKAEAQMEGRQFKRLADEKMAHDQQEIIVLKDLLFKRDQALQALSSDVQVLRSRLSSYEHQTPTTPASAANDIRPYPALRCTIPAVDSNHLDESADLNKYAFGETPREQFQNPDQRIYQPERTPSSNVMEKGVIGYYSPRRPRHLRGISFASFGWGSFRRVDEFPLAVDRAILDSDDMIDRVYTIDAVHGAATDDWLSTPRHFGLRKEKVDAGGYWRDEGEIKKLYRRLQALEADRESMRQNTMSRSADKAQMLLLREIAQQLWKEAAVSASAESKVVKQPSFNRRRRFSIVSTVKWLASFVFWRRKVALRRYPFGLSSNNSGLLLLLEKSPRASAKRRKCLT